MPNPYGVVIPISSLPPGTGPDPDDLCLCGDWVHPDGACPRRSCGCQISRPVEATRG